MIQADPSVGHRLLAPRVAYCIGTVGVNGANIAPVSNVTSVSRTPQVVVIAVFREWQTFKNLEAAKGFTISVPHRAQNEAVWRLGEKYSGFNPPEGQTKLQASGATIDYNSSSFGPVLASGIGWLECQLVGSSDIESDHGIFFGGVTKAYFNDEFLTEEGLYKKNSEPVMQVVGNSFATSSEHWTNSYFK